MFISAEKTVKQELENRERMRRRLVNDDDGDDDGTAPLNSTALGQVEERVGAEKKGRRKYI